MAIVRRKNAKAACLAKTPTSIAGAQCAFVNRSRMGAAKYLPMFNRVLMNSTCKVRVARSIDLEAVEINFSGLAARFPSMSNDRAIQSRRSKNGRHIAIGHTDEAVARMDAATALYMAEISKCDRVPQFGNVLVYVRIMLADDRFIKDSHNHSKAICDWLQTLNIVNNDDQIECAPAKKKEYFRETEHKETRILVVRRTLVENFLEEANERFNKYFSSRLGIGVVA